MSEKEATSFSKKSLELLSKIDLFNQMVTSQPNEEIPIPN